MTWPSTERFRAHSLVHNLTSIQSCRRTPCSTCVTSIPYMPLFSRVIYTDSQYHVERDVTGIPRFLYNPNLPTTYYVLSTTTYCLLPTTTYYHLPPLRKRPMQRKSSKRETNAILTICKITDKEALVTLYALFD